MTLSTADFASLTQAIDHYLTDSKQSLPTAIYAAVAGPVVGGQARLTNSFWTIDRTALQTHYQLDDVQILNDFTAIAHALAVLGPEHCRSLGGPALTRNSARQCFGVIGPGTGLGAAGLITQQQQRTLITTEAGHLGFAPESELQAFIYQRLASRFARVSDERLVSGQGIENLYWALSELDPEDPAGQVNAATVFERFDLGTDPTATATVEAFFRILGQVAGNLVLALGAFDGLFIAGGIAQRHGQLLLESAFRDGFEAKGRHRPIMEQTPTLLIEHAHPGLIGAMLASLG